MFFPGNSRTNHIFNSNQKMDHPFLNQVSVEKMIMAKTANAEQ